MAKEQQGGEGNNGSCFSWFPSSGRSKTFVIMNISFLLLLLILPLMIIGGFSDFVCFQGIFCLGFCVDDAVLPF